MFDYNNWNVISWVIIAFAVLVLFYAESKTNPTGNFLKKHWQTLSFVVFFVVAVLVLIFKKEIGQYWGDTAFRVVSWIIFPGLFIFGLSSRSKMRNQPPVSRLKRLRHIFVSSCVLGAAIYAVILSEKIGGPKLFGGMTGYTVAMCIIFGIGFLGFVYLCFSIARFICGK